MVKATFVFKATCIIMFVNQVMFNVYFLIHLSISLLFFQSICLQVDAKCLHLVHKVWCASVFIVRLAP